MAFLHRKLLFTSETILYRASQYPPPPLSHKTLYTSPILLLIVSAVGGVFLLYCYRLIFDKCHSYLNRNTASLDHTHEDIIDEEHGSVVDHPIWYINTVGLEQSVIDSITVFIYKSHEKLVEGTECSVCLNGFQEDESLRLLPKCSHAFHISCIDTWLRSHKNCPLCRAPIVCVDTLEPNLNEVSVEPQTPLENLETSETRGENNSVLEIDDRKLIDDSAKVGRELETMRRSISMVNFALANIHSVGNRGSWGQDNTKRVGKLDSRKSRTYRVMIKSCSFRSSAKKGPVCMKRSLSSSGKCAKPRYSRSHDSFLPM